MRSSARIVIAGLALAAGTVPALADDELLKTQPFPEQPAPAPSPVPTVPKRAPSPPPAPPPSTAQQGEPGMMGMPWPKTPEEATKTLNNLYAFLATTGDHRQAGEIGAAIEQSGWGSRADHPKFIQAMEGLSGVGSTAYPQGDFQYRREDHQIVHDQYIECIRDGELQVVAVVDRAQLGYPPEVDYTTETL